MARYLMRILVLLSAVLTAAVATAQNPAVTRSQEVSEIDGLPVLVKHWPDWEKSRTLATFANNVDGLKKALGERPILDLIDFSAGTEAVTAPYSTGKLLIVEYPTPQASTDADNRFLLYLSQHGDSRTLYRRIGSYSVFVFDVSDEAAASQLIDQVKYEKTVQWLGEDPFLLKKLERNFVNSTTDLFIATLEVIVIGMALSVLGGIIIGYFYFQFREKQRRAIKEFSDAGGMIRLNLDGLTPKISTGKLLGE